MTTTYDFPAIGCYVDCSAQSADDCNRRTIRFASGYGFIAGSLTSGDSDEYSEELSAMADNAVMFLNDKETRDGFYWEFDDNSLYLRND